MRSEKRRTAAGPSTLHGAKSAPYSAQDDSLLMVALDDSLLLIAQGDSR